jgi:cytoskeletal protein CcmA (bactofilin family)
MSSSHTLFTFTRRIITFSAVAGALGTLATAQTATLEPGNQAARADNYYAAGNHVEITTPMARDVVVAGRQVDIAQSVAGDILAAGWRVTVTGRADDDVRIGGGEVLVNAPILGDLTVAGGNVAVGSQTRVGGRSWITGRMIRIDGAFERELRVAGANVQVAGVVRSPVDIVAEKLEILPSARILGPLTYRGPHEALISEGAVISGPVRFDRISEREAQRARGVAVGSTLLFSIHLFLAGMLVLVFAPRFEQSIVATLRVRPARSLLTGFVSLITIPIAAVLLVVSVLGLPIGLVIAALYAIALFGGVLVTAFLIGDLEAMLLKFGPISTRGQHAVLLLAGVLTLAVLRSLLGGFVVFVSVVLGLGALTLGLHAAYSRVSQPAVG